MARPRTLVLALTLREEMLRLHHLAKIERPLSRRREPLRESDPSRPRLDLLEELLQEELRMDSDELFAEHLVHPVHVTGVDGITVVDHGEVGEPQLLQGTHCEH